jgi:hypothetical protein
LNIGVKGALSEDAQTLTAGCDVFNGKLSASKNMECLRFLICCGIQIIGMDVNEKKPKLSDIESLTISYPENPAMLTGLKIMATAEAKLGTNINHNILMRCDYGVIKKDGTETMSILKDTIHPLSPGVRDFLLRLHQRHMDKGLTCMAEIKGFWIKIMHSYKKREIWGINASLNNGFQINVKAKNMQKYADAITDFPSPLRELIAKGYGCGKKMGTSDYCDDGCKGFRIPLDDSILGIRKGIEVWLDLELSR